MNRINNRYSPNPKKYKPRPQTRVVMLCPVCFKVTNMEWTQMWLTVPVYTTEIVCWHCETKILISFGVKGFINKKQD